MSYVAPVSAVLIIRCTASLATSSGPTTRPMGSVARSCSRRASRSSPSSVADSGVSTNPAAMRLTRIGATSSARLATRAGIAAVAAAIIDRPRPRLRPPVPPMKIRVPPGRTRPTACWAGASNHHEVDLGGQAAKEPVEGSRVGGVEGRGAARADFGRGPLEALGVPPGQDDLGALGTGAAGGLQPDAGAAADGDHDLAEEFGFARGDSDGCVGGHDCFLLGLVRDWPQHRWGTASCPSATTATPQSLPGRPRRARENPGLYPGPWPGQPGPPPDLGPRRYLRVLRPQ